LARKAGTNNTSYASALVAFHFKVAARRCCSHLTFSPEKKKVTGQAADGITLTTWHDLTLIKRDSSRR
jgi:hypothetical protein